MNSFFMLKNFPLTLIFWSKFFLALEFPFFFLLDEISSSSFRIMMNGPAHVFYKENQLYKLTE